MGARTGGMGRRPLVCARGKLAPALPEKGNREILRSSAEGGLPQNDMRVMVATGMSLLRRIGGPRRKTKGSRSDPCDGQIYKLRGG